MQKVHIKDRNVEYLEGKINELEINGKNKNIIDLYRGIKKFNFGYHTWTDLVKFRRANFMQIHTLLWIGGRITSFNYLMYFGLMILARLKLVHRAGGLCVEVEVAIEKLTRYKWTGMDQITAEFYSFRRGRGVVQCVLKYIK